MRIVKLTATGFMSRVIDTILHPITAFVGANETGKSSHLLAAQLALAGYIPMLGKTPRAAYDRLATAGTMQVCAEFDDGRGITRRWSAGKKDTVSADAQFTGMEESEWKFPAVLIDPEVYFGLSDRDRVNFVFGLVDLSKEPFDVDAITAKVKAIRVEAHGERHEKIINELAEEVRVTWGDRGQTEQSLQDWIGELVESFTTRTTEARAAVKRMQGTVSGLSEMKAQNPNTVAPRNVEAELDAAQKDYDRLRNEYTKVDTQLKAAHQSASRRKELEATLAGMGAGQKVVDDLRGKITALEKLTGDYQTDTLGLTNKLAEARAGLATAAQMRASLHDQMQSREKELAKLLEKELCKKCAAKLTRSAKTTTSRIEGELKTLAVVIPEWEETVLNRDTELNASKERDAQDFKNRAQLRTAKDELREKEKTLPNAEAIRAELTGMGGAVDVAGLEGKLETLKQSGVAAKQKLEDVRTQQNAFNAAQAAKNSAAQAEENVLVNQADLDVSGAAVKVLQTMQAELVATAFGKILALANELAAPILKSPLEYHEGEIGRREEGHWVSHRTFSGKQRLVGYAAISLALAASAPCKIVMLDEMGRLDKETKTKLLGLLQALIAKGVLHQALLVDVDGGGYLGTDAHVITVA